MRACSVAFLRWPVEIPWHVGDLSVRYWRSWSLVALEALMATWGRCRCQPL